jgi:hypothetical protein
MLGEWNLAIPESLHPLEQQKLEHRWKYQAHRSTCFYEYLLFS